MVNTQPAMKLDMYLQQPRAAYLYAERYVNKGSPSGFSEKYTTSPSTSSKSLAKGFYLYGIRPDDRLKPCDFGTIPDFFKSRLMLIHPDMASHRLFANNFLVSEDTIFVAPTASSRTVMVLDDNPWFLKLSYDGLIGRMPRQISKNHAASAIEVSSLIESAIDAGKVSEKFFFMREPFGRVLDVPDGNGGFYEWGIVLREPNPYPENSRLRFIIPGFSLFSKDVLRPRDRSLLFQLIERQNKTVEAFLFEDIIVPIYEAYFRLLLNCGLQLEAHAQNTLFALDQDFQILGVIAKDCESIDKDLSLSKDLGLDVEIRTKPYKCLERGAYNYHIMHSFMFDFKLGKYLILPIIREARRCSYFDVPRLVRKIREYNEYYICQLPRDFFPSDGKWYSYDNIVHERSSRRPYVGLDIPAFRFS